MSHFAVVVTGDYEEALAPYHEFECTGEDDQYVVDVDVTEEKLSEYKKYGEDGQSFLDYLEDNDYAELTDQNRGTDDVKYGYFIRGTDGQVEKVIRRTNPNSKWDWYQLGGRYSGRLILKDGSVADTAKNSEIDWDAIRHQKAKLALELYDAVKEVARGRVYTPWSYFLGRVGKGQLTIDTAREHHNAQEILQDFRQDERIGYWVESKEFDEILKDNNRELYGKTKGHMNGCFWSLLHAGKWAERGNMGWWGMSDATTDSEKAYADYFWETIVTIDPDTQISVVDCHI